MKIVMESQRKTRSYEIGPTWVRPNGTGTGMTRVPPIKKEISIIQSVKIYKFKKKENEIQ